MTTVTAVRVSDPWPDDQKLNGEVNVVEIMIYVCSL